MGSESQRRRGLLFWEAIGGGSPGAQIRDSEPGSGAGVRFRRWLGKASHCQVKIIINLNMLDFFLLGFGKLISQEEQ